MLVSKLTTAATVFTTVLGLAAGAAVFARQDQAGGSQPGSFARQDQAARGQPGSSSPAMAPAGAPADPLANTAVNRSDEYAWNIVKLARETAERQGAGDLRGAARLLGDLRRTAEDWSRSLSASGRGGSNYSPGGAPVLLPRANGGTTDPGNPRPAGLATPAAGSATAANLGTPAPMSPQPGSPTTQAPVNPQPARLGTPAQGLPAPTNLGTPAQVNPPAASPRTSPGYPLPANGSAAPAAGMTDPNMPLHDTGRSISAELADPRGPLRPKASWDSGGPSQSARRLDELEAKVDKILRLLEGQAARP
jgi:hypothetical protein